MQLPKTEKSGALWKTALVGLAAALIFIFWGGVALEILGVVFGGAVLAFLLTPMARMLEKKLKRPLAAFLTLAIVLLFLLALLGLLLPILIRQFSVLVELIPEAFFRIRSLVNHLIRRLQDHLPDIALPDFSFTGAQKNLGGMAKDAVNYLSGVGAGLYRLSLMAILSCFFIADRERILLRLELLLPFHQRALWVRAGNTLVREMKMYIRGQATIALAVGALAALAMLILGVPGAPLLGALVGLFNIIPYFGPIIGGIPAVLSALSLGWQKAVLTLLALFLVQQMDGLVLSPRVMGGVTGFSPAVVLLSLFVGARLGGVGGMLFALPILMAIRTLYRVFVQRYEKN